MKELIKTIRAGLKLNQEQLAAMMGVSPVTVNRWENGRAVPSLMAQKQLYEISMKQNLDLTDHIVRKDGIGEGRSLLFHASRSGISGRIEPISRSRCDFGRGFYMGTDPIQPLTLVCNERSPKFYTLELDMADLSVLDVGIGIEWAMLIAYYRGYMEQEAGSTIYDKYAHMADGCDIIIGYIANDRMYQVLTDFFEGRITDTALVGSLSALKLGRQYVAVTQRACDQITVRSERTLQKIELMFLRDKSVVRRKEGVALSDKIVMQHRRDGRYFDEILRGEEI